MLALGNEQQKKSGSTKKAPSLSFVAKTALS